MKAQRKQWRHLEKSVRNKNRGLHSNSANRIVKKHEITQERIFIYPSFRPLLYILLGHILLFLEGFNKRFVEICVSCVICG